MQSTPSANTQNNNGQNDVSPTLGEFLRTYALAGVFVVSLGITGSLTEGSISPLLRSLVMTTGIYAICSMLYGCYAQHPVLGRPGVRTAIRGVGAALVCGGAAWTAIGTMLTA